MAKQAHYAAAPDYTGEKLWTVTHPEFGQITVLAPTREAAIPAAARIWKTRWQAYAFYSAATVVYLGSRRTVGGGRAHG